mgnify:CR=1 FL=1
MPRLAAAPAFAAATAALVLSVCTVRQVALWTDTATLFDHTVRVTGETRLEPGDRVRVVPNHSCVVSNLVDAVRLVDGDRVIDTLPVAARGRIQ